jgi:hypothetical protein
VKRAFKDWSMANISVILKGIKVKRARYPEYNKVLLLDARFLGLTEQKNELASYVVANNENLCITSKGHR